MQIKDKAVDQLRKMERSPAWDRASAYIVIHPNRKDWGKIQCAWPKDGMGRLRVFVWDTQRNGLQYGYAGGCGYDKLTAALCGLVFDGIKLGDHPNGGWEKLLKEKGYEIIRAI